MAQEATGRALEAGKIASKKARDTAGKTVKKATDAGKDASEKIQGTAKKSVEKAADSIKKLLPFGNKEKNKGIRMNEKGYSKYQQKVIKNFYDNKDLRLVQKLGELVSNLYLETSEKKKETGWKKIKKMLADLKVHPGEVEYLTKDKTLSLISKKLDEIF